jgi:hypothetical protein
MSSWPRPGRSAAAGPRSWTLVSHGNAGNLSHRLDRSLLLPARLRSGAPASPTSAAEGLRQVTGEGRRARPLDRASELDEGLRRIVDVAHLAVGAHCVLYFDLDRQREQAQAHLHLPPIPGQLPRGAA